MKYPKEWPGFMSGTGQLREMVSVFEDGQGEYRSPLAMDDHSWEIELDWVLNNWTPLTPTAREILAIARGAK